MQNALKTIRNIRPDFHPTVGVLLGSGWNTLTDHIAEATRISYEELEEFPTLSIAGHAGELWLGRIGDTCVAALSGRQHVYETDNLNGMKIPIRTLKALGCKVLVQTNAAGSLDPGLPTGSLMALSDHINFVQRSPLVGEEGSGRFVSMVDAYHPGLRGKAREVAHQRGQHLFEGVYGWCLGPQFETPAEIRALSQLGCRAVGMSTVPETILARHCGLEVLAISLITNLAAGLSTVELSHAQTLKQAQHSSAQAGGLLAGIISQISFP